MVVQDMNEEILEKYKINFGLYVKEHRERKGYTQQQLSELIGITPKSISYIERGENYPSPDNLFELAKVLDMSLDEFVFSHKKFDKTICFEEVNQRLEQLSSKNQAILISIIDSVSTTLLLTQEDLS